MDSKKPLVWYNDFNGVGYRYHDVFMNVFPLFENKMEAYKLWQKTVEWWPDDEIRLRFVEAGDFYWFILYGSSKYKGDRSGFVKRVQISENYKRFKEGLEKKALVRFGIYKPNSNKKEKDGSKKLDLEILKKSKSAYDVQFLKFEDLAPDSVEMECILIHRDKENENVPQV